MNINPYAKRILFFGDSLTYGRIPNWKRYITTKRFTWVTQEILWNDYEVIEEWLRWRTLYWENKWFFGRQWNTQFWPILWSHLPIDLLVIMLWTNDANNYNDIYNEQQIYSYLDEYIDQIHWRCESIWVSHLPQLLLISPPNISKNYEWILFQGSHLKINIIQESIKSYANVHNIQFIESANYIQPSEIDWVHLDEENNKILWTIIANKIKEIL